MKKILSIIISSICLLGTAISASYAWFAHNASIQLHDMEGNILTSYFHCGNGTAENPFVITRPVHLYNLTELYHELPGFDTSKYHFQLGYDLDNNPETLEFYNYDDDNKIISYDGKTSYSESLNMKAYEGKFGPIGSIEYPFNGSFDGKGLTISNLTVTAKGQGDAGFFGYVGSQADIHDIYFGDLTIDVSNLSAAHINTVVQHDDLPDEEIHPAHDEDYCYVGYLCGHCETWTSFANVYMNFAAITGISGQSIKNKYGYFGYAADAADLDMMVYKLKGDNRGWGGSIEMNEIYLRIDGYNNTQSYKQDQFKNSEYHYFNNGVEDLSKYKETYQVVNTYEYYNDDLTGRITYGQATANYLWGIRNYNIDYTITNEYHTDSDPTYYYYKYNDYYLNFKGGNAIIGTSENDITKIFIDDDGYAYYVYNNSNYYLYSVKGDSDGTLSSSTSRQSYMFKLDNNKLRLYRVSNNTPTSRYVFYRNKDNNFVVRKDSSQSALSAIDFKTEVKTSTLQYSTNGTYIPLNVYANTTDDLNQIAIDQAKLGDSETLVVNGAKYDNTGYIIGGTKNVNDNYGSAVRIAENYNFSHLSRALNSSNTSTYNGNNLQILTRTKDTTGGPVYISDDYNKNISLTTNQRDLTYLGDKYKHTVQELGLNMYMGARNNLEEQFLNTTIRRDGTEYKGLRVMRFNEFQVNMDHIITAEKVLINGEIKTNYQFPESCIDFNLKDKGYISFFGGGFRGGNCNAFFSLYHVIRDDNENISALKKMKKIYGTESNKKQFIYEYEDGSFAIYNKKTKTYEPTTNPLSQGYEMYFDMNWVEAPGFTRVDNTCWYFEIPVNQGEYALGAVDGRTGAYMFYLDVGTAGGGTETVQNFVDIDYRNPVVTHEIDPNTGEQVEQVSEFLFSYEETEAENVQIKTEYDATYDEGQGAYIVTVSSTNEFILALGIMKENTTVVVNGEEYKGIDYYEITINGS